MALGKTTSRASRHRISQRILGFIWYLCISYRSTVPHLRQHDLWRLKMLFLERVLMPLIPWTTLGLHSFRCTPLRNRHLCEGTLLVVPLGYFTAWSLCEHSSIVLLQPFKYSCLHSPSAFEHSPVHLQLRRSPQSSPHLGLWKLP